MAAGSGERTIATALPVLPGSTVASRSSVGVTWLQGRVLCRNHRTAGRSAISAISSHRLCLGVTRLGRIAGHRGRRSYRFAGFTGCGRRDVIRGINSGTDSTGTADATAGLVP